VKTLLLLVLLAMFVAVAPAAKPEATRVENLEIAKRVEAIILPEVSYREATVTEIVAHLNRVSKDLDANKVGVPIELSAAAKASDTRITLSLKNVPLIEVIKYLTNLGRLKYKITASKVMISTMEEK
jgi:hypothetical protein